uniref:Uncharacterized protein n=1 Tax=Solanum lycopersicum TaxID=4081 RepID=A0A3Q7JJS8_SOLLC
MDAKHPTLNEKRVGNLVITRGWVLPAMSGANRGFTAAVLLELSADGPVHRIQYQKDGKIRCWQAAAEIVAVLAGVVEEEASVPLQFEKTQGNLLDVMMEGEGEEVEAELVSEKVIGLSNLSRFSGDAKGKLEVKPVDFNPLLSDAASSATRDERTEEVTGLGGGGRGGMLINCTEGGVGSVVLVTSIGRIPVFTGGAATLGDATFNENSSRESAWSAMPMLAFGHMQLLKLRRYNDNSNLSISSEPWRFPEQESAENTISKVLKGTNTPYSNNDLVPRMQAISIITKQ